MQFSLGINKALYLKRIDLSSITTCCHVHQILKRQTSKDANSKKKIFSERGTLIVYVP